MTKGEIKENDILVFKNGHVKYFHESERYILNHFYRDNMVCEFKDEFTIVAIYRPSYEKMFDSRQIEGQQKIK